MVSVCQANLVEVSQDVFLLNFENCHELCSTFLRFQEHYESPEYAGKIFTLDEFKKWYQGDDGEFTYYSDWSGFNIPSWVLDPFLEGKFDPLSPEEEWFLSFFHEKVGGNKFYIIGTFGKKGGSALKHETAHGLFYVNPTYKKEVQEVIKSLPKKTVNQIKKALSFDYHENSLEDEIHAYTMEELATLDIELTPEVEQASAKLCEIYERYWEEAKLSDEYDEDDEDGGPLIDDCKNKRYKGIRRPGCNKGYGCLVCWGKYNSRRYAKLPEFNRHWKELKEEAPDWFPGLVADPEDDPFDGKNSDGTSCSLNESLLSELCWSFFMRGLELKLGPAKKEKASDAGK